MVDSCSVQQFNERLEIFKNLWDTREMPFAPASGPRFYHYFQQYQADVVRYHMRKDLRESVGLGCPPSKFTTNASALMQPLKEKLTIKSLVGQNLLIK